ncbi:MAG: 1-acyl-sn-glycerol-3-phosphate acyltransferase [Actinomycetota bacterium]|jgi:1-acyl-sn-glycerol-3-phosphate acyltransferase|nr:1-acyl-sn-glycerol-3-phosphate acyltransferase [Actinomycetota bacterium]
MYWVFKAILKPLLRALYGIKVEGIENIPKKGAAILAANHVSFLDSFFIPLIVRFRKVTYLAKADYFKTWKTSWFFKMAGQIPIEREGGEKSEVALNTALKVLKGGDLLGIYPEGTRSPNGKLHRGRTGVARLALAADVPIIPIGLVGTEDVMPKEAKMPRLVGRPKVIVKIGRPLDFSRFADRGRDRFVLRSMTDELMYEIMQLSGQEYVDEYASRTATEPLPESARMLDEIKLEEEVLAG